MEICLVYYLGFETIFHVMITAMVFDSSMATIVYINIIIYLNNMANYYTHTIKATKAFWFNIMKAI